ncbi:trk system potassium uptake protein TrkA [Lachnospiraceae bacterium XBB1006]|nr:trk system potassium uptake protein TrkA [Lachnospiraceae bacterium XBB1006]
MTKSIAVLGLGKYGMSLAQNMYDMGADVLIVDRNEDLLEDCADFSTAAVCADLENEDEVAALGLKNMDIVVVAMGGNLAASILCVAVAKEQGVPKIVAKSASNRMSSILKKIGADKVIIPEEYSGQQSARILASNVFLDYFQVDNTLCMVEMKPLSKWVGKNLCELNIRKHYKVYVVAVKEGEHWEIIDPNRVMKEEDELLIVSDKDALHRINRV